MMMRVDLCFQFYSKMESIDAQVFERFRCVFFWMRTSLLHTRTHLWLLDIWTDWWPPCSEIQQSNLHKNLSCIPYNQYDHPCVYFYWTDTKNTPLFYSPDFPAVNDWSSILPTRWLSNLQTDFWTILVPSVSSLPISVDPHTNFHKLFSWILWTRWPKDWNPSNGISKIHSCMLHPIWMSTDSYLFFFLYFWLGLWILFDPSHPLRSWTCCMYILVQGPWTLIDEIILLLSIDEVVLGYGQNQWLLPSWKIHFHIHIHVPGERKNIIGVKFDRFTVLEDNEASVLGNTFVWRGKRVFSTVHCFSTSFEMVYARTIYHEPRGAFWSLVYTSFIPGRLIPLM